MDAPAVLRCQVMAARPKKMTPKKTKALKATPKSPTAKAPARPERDSTQAARPERSVAQYIRTLPPPIKPLVKLIRQIVKDAAPEAKELLAVGGPVYEANGVFARISPREREVLIQFLSSADSARGKKQKSKSVHLSVESVSKLQRSVLRSMVREAVALNLGKKPLAD